MLVLALFVVPAATIALSMRSSQSRHLEDQQHGLAGAWKEKEVLDKFVEKDIREIDRMQGAVQMLKDIRTTISKEAYEDRMRQKRKELSVYLDYRIADNREFEEILAFFGTQNSISTADKVKAVFTLANVLMVVAIIITILALGSVVSIFVFPYFSKLSGLAKAMLFYAWSASITVGAFFCPERYSNYVGFFGALCLGLAYGYHLDVIGGIRLDYAIFLPPMLVWAILAIALHTRLIGFIAVGALAGFLGFGVWVSPLGTLVGFPHEEPMFNVAFSSACLMAVYVARVMGYFNQVSRYIEPFDVGLQFIGTIAYFSALLIMSSRHYRESTFVCANLFFVFSAIAALALGLTMMPLVAFRGVGLTFLVLYLLIKYAEIEWGHYWSCGLLGGGFFLIAICFLLKQYGAYFIFWSL